MRASTSGMAQTAGSASVSGQRDDASEAHSLYKQAIAIDPYHARNLGNYGLFLADIMGDITKA